MKLKREGKHFSEHAAYQNSKHFSNGSFTSTLPIPRMIWNLNTSSHFASSPLQRHFHQPPLHLQSKPTVNPHTIVPHRITCLTLMFLQPLAYTSQWTYHGNQIKYSTTFSAIACTSNRTHQQFWPIRVNKHFHNL
jgi:hypothetical protein